MANVARHYECGGGRRRAASAVAALAHARRGARVALCEANPSSTWRLAGEWLHHPRAIPVLHDFGTDLPSAIPEHAVLSAEAFEGAANGVRGRRIYGRGDRFLVGDAVGYHYPLTAVGMALDFKNALCLTHCQSAAEYRARRRPPSRVAELLAVGLYEALTDSADEAVAAPCSGA